MLSIRIKKEAKKEKTIEEHIATIYQFLYEIADTIEENNLMEGDNKNTIKEIKIRGW